MRALLFLALLVPLGCRSSGSPQLLCSTCTDDTECGGSPCFQDVSGSRFCGSSCTSCPDGYSCQPVSGTGGQVVETCFPASELCPILGADAASGTGGPTGVDAGPLSGDLGIPAGGSVGPKGGTVDRLFFGITGDTRPDVCGGTYPQTTINNIFIGMKQKGVQFAVDQGDHMFNCGSTSSAFTGAKQQMAKYTAATALLGAPVFMTMGNHECTGTSSALCTANSYGGNANYTAFMDALMPISMKPYYRIDVMTHSGLAVFVVIADDAWDTTQQQWLTTQLTDADAHAKYTFVSKHHPEGNMDHTEFPQIYNLVRQHKYTLFLTGHSHLFKRQPNDPRALVIGCGGAPLAGGSFWGYGTVLQGADDRIYVQIYDQATGNVMSAFDVAPQ